MTAFAVPMTAPPKVNPHLIYAKAGWSTEALQVARAMVAARLHWDERPTIIVLQLDSLELPSSPIPLHPTMTVKGRYKFAGRLQPLPYPIDE